MASESNPWSKKIASKLPRGLLQCVLGFVEFGDCGEIIEPGAGEVLLGLNGFKDDAHGKFSSLLSQGERLLCGGERAARGDHLVLKRLPVSERDDDLPGEFVADFFEGELRLLHAGIGGV